MYKKGLVVVFGAGTLVWILASVTMKHPYGSNSTTYFSNDGSHLSTKETGLVNDGKRNLQLKRGTTGYIANGIETQQVRRQGILRKGCSELGMTGSLPEDDAELMRLVKNTRLFYSDKHKFLACEIPKCGCTNFKKVLVTIEGLTKDTDPRKVIGSRAHSIANNQLMLSRFQNASEIRHRLNTYFKFVMVREPLHRLLSAYRNKLEGTEPRGEYFKEISRQIHKNFSGGNDSSTTATFPQFLRYVAQPGIKRDIHWNFYHKLCSPCVIKYDFIAHLETVNEDMAYFMKTTNIKNMKYPRSYEPSRTTDWHKVRNYTKSSPELVSSVFDTYKDDFRLFGYPRPNLQQNA